MFSLKSVPRVLLYCFGVLLLYSLEEHVVDCGLSMEDLKNTTVICLDLFNLTKGIFTGLLKLKLFPCCIC